MIRTLANKAGILAVVYILLYQIKTLRRMIFCVLQYIGVFIENSVMCVNMHLDLKADYVLQIYKIGEKCAQCIIVISILLNIFYFFWTVYNSRKKQLLSKESAFEIALAQYLEWPDRRAFLVKGEWGSGKTHHVNAYLEKYYKNTFTNVYRISCFGLSSRKELLDEIESVIQSEDNSLSACIFDLLQYVPVIGSVLSQILHKSYSISNTKKSSIFVFDDFERIMVNYSQSHDYNQPYSGVAKGTLINMRRQLSPDSREVLSTIEESIGSEFDKIQKAFNTLSSDFDDYILLSEISKVNTAVGLINEITDNYNKRVIIICNDFDLPNDLSHALFVEKLNCKMFNIKTSKFAKTELAKETLKQKNILKGSKIDIVFNKYYEPCISIPIRLSISDNNLRYYSTFYHSILDTLEELNDEMLDDQLFVESLFYSMYLIHCRFNGQQIKELNCICNGQHLGLIFKMINAHKDLADYFIERNLRWVSPKMSGKWLYNYTASDFDKVYNDFRNYRFIEVERKLIEGDFDLLSSDITLTHYIYIQLQKGTTKTEGQHLLENNLVSIEDSYSSVDILFSLMQTLLSVYHIEYDEIYTVIDEKMLDILLVERSWYPSLTYDYEDWKRKKNHLIADNS